MIRHIVMFSASRPEDVPSIEQGLRLLSSIPDALHFEVGRNLQCDALGNDIACVVYAEFADDKALARYKAHPLYQEAIRIVRPLRELRIAADIVAPAVRLCMLHELPEVYAIINQAAQRYGGVIPADCFHVPYLSMQELHQALNDGIVFYGYVQPQGGLAGVMGVQHVQDVSLLRHAYVLPQLQGKGIGAALLQAVICEAVRYESACLYVGAWSDADWAITFYQRHGFTSVPKDKQADLLMRYWGVGERQIACSEVLARSL